MIQEVRTYICDDSPKDADIEEAISIAKREGVIIKLEWVIKYSGRYTTVVRQDSTIESVRKQIPKVYGM